MKTILASLILVSALSSSAFAQARVNEIDQRLSNQTQRIDAGAASGQLTAKQTAVDSKRDQHVATELSKDQAKNGGHITKGEQVKMNKQLNKDSTKIHHQRVKGAKKQAATTTPVAQ